MHAGLVQRLEEELVELAIEQRPIEERVAEHEPAAAEPWLSGELTQRGAEAGNSPSGDERLELPADAGRLLGVDQPKGA